MTETISLTQNAYDMLRRDILQGRLLPNSPLRIDRLKNGYKIGASPLREALSRLLTDGLVTSEEQKGFRVAPVSIEDFRDITNVRKLVECEALRLSIELGDRDWEGRLVVAHYHLARSETPTDAAGKAADDFDRLTKEFHHALIAGCGSPHLIRIAMRLYDLSGRYRKVTLVNNPKRGKDLNHEHDDLFNVSLKRDLKKAVQLLGEHIEHTFESVSQAFLQLGRKARRGHQN